MHVSLYTCSNHRFRLQPGGEKFIGCILRVIVFIVIIQHSFDKNGHSPSKVSLTNDVLH